jgi:hypothetical protein
MTQSNATDHLSNPAARAVTIRRATEADATGLRRLAALDSRRPLVGPAIVAEVDGVLWAARALVTPDVVADPFRPTADLVGLLHERARHLLQDAEAGGSSSLGALLGALRPRSHGLRSG